MAAVAVIGSGAVESRMTRPFDTLCSANRRRHEDWVEERDAYWDQLFPRRDRLTVSTEDDLLDALIRFFKARMRTVRR